MSAPERIWAEMQPYEFSGYSPCWVWHHPESLEDGSDGAVQYTRADLCAPIQDERVKEALQDMVSLFSADNVLLKGTHLNATLELARAALRALEQG